MNANLPHLKEKYFVYFLISVVIFFIDTSRVLNAQSVHVGPAADDNSVKNGFGPIIVSEQSSDRTGIYYSACELGLKSGVSIQKLVFQLNDTSNLPYFSPGISVKLKNSTRCRLDAWNSWESATSGSVSMGVINPEIIVNGGGKFVIFIFSNPFSYSGKGIEMFFESTDTTHHPINFLTYQSPGNMQFWSGNLIAPENNNYKPIMDIELNQLNAQSLPSNANLEIKSCDNLYEVCLGEPICLTISPTANATVPLVVPPDLQVKWTFGTSNVQFSSGSTAANFDLIFNPGDAIKCQILSSTGLVLRTKTIFTTNWTILDNPNDPFVCFDDEPMGTEIGSRISEVVFAKKVNGQFMPMLKSLTDYEGVASYSLNVNPTLAFSNLQPLFSQYPPMINEYGTFTDFSNILQQSDAIPEVRIGDTLKFDLRMSKALKPAMFNHIAKMEVDWNADMLIDSSYYYSFDDGIPFFQVSPTSGLLYSTDMSNSDTIRYSRNVVVPITSTPNSTVRVLAELKKNPTGWDEREGYSIKILCQKPKIVVHGSGTFCAGDTLFASVYNPLNYALDYKWYKDGVLVATIASPVNYFIPASSGVYTVQADFVPNECAEFSNGVTITVYPLPASPTLTNGSRCGNGTVNLGATAASGSVVDWYNNLSGGVSFNTGTTYTTPSLSSTTTYYVESRNSTTGCVSTPRTAVAATINALPASPTVTNGSRCGNGTVNLGATAASGSVVDWYNNLSGGVSFNTGTTYTTPSLSSTTTYYVESRNSTTGCVSTPRTAVTATINALPASPTVTNGSRCGNGTVNLGATAASGSVVDWYNNLSGGVSFNTGTTYTTPSLSSTTTYYVESRNSTTGCVSTPRTAVTATINALPASPTVTNGSRCGNGTVNLGATAASGSVVDWYNNLSGGVSFNTGTTYTTLSLSSTTTYYVESRNSTTGCVSTPRTAVTATINALPASPTVTNGSRCGNGTVNLGATAASGSVVDWYNNLSGGVSFNTGTTYTTPSLSSTTTYYVESRNSTTGCVSTPRTAVTATINALPASPTVTNGSRCGNGTVNLGATAASGSVVDWYNNLSGGVSFNTGTTYTTPSLSSTTTYYVESRNNTTGCVSTPRTAVTATINALPASPTVTNGSRCGNGTVNLGATAASGSVVDWYNNLSGGVSFSTGTTYTTPSLSSTTTYYVESRNSTTGCVSTPRTAVTATISVSANYYTDNDGDGYGTGSAIIACVQPSNSVTNNTDCNDALASVYPGAIEICNGLDDDCDSNLDDGLPFVNYYNDADGDGYGAGAATSACQSPGAGYVINNTDCNDGSSSIYPGALETCNGLDDDCDSNLDNGLPFVNYYNDADGDGYGAGAATSACQSPGAGYVSNNTDCNDGSASIYPGAPETCNGFDDDCDSNVDDELTFVNYYNDADGDAYGAGPATNACQSPGASYVINNTDCDDSNAFLNPISAEICNSVDDDCDGLVDDGLTFVNYYNDADGDTYGAGPATNACQSPGASYVNNNTDCDDSNASLNSISSETCNGLDDDCDGLVDDGLTFVNYYNDADGDTYGAGPATNACQSPGASYVTNNTDCDDSNASLNSISSETCNGLDDDCDGLVDDGLTFVNYYNDADGDTYGAGPATNACQSPGASYVTNNTDCNDAALAVNPGVSESCNSIDDDCDALIDEGCAIGSALLNAVEITSLPQFGLSGGNFSQNVNMASQTDSPEYGGTYPEKWFKFVAQSNAVRIAVTGASSADDNAMAIYDDPGLSYATPLIPIDVADAVNLSSVGAADQGNEILLTDQLVVGNTYYVAVATVNGTPGSINVKFNTLLPSSCDIALYTGGTNTYSNVCANFKCRYRQNAKQGILHRWASNIIAGAPLQSYTIPPSSIMNTVCQLSKFVPANISGSPQTIYVSADVQYELPDAAGVIHYLTAISTSTCSFTLNAEPSINLRSTDACPNFKTTLSSLATDRSVCGTSQYQWEFTMAFPSPGLPFNVSGSLGGSRILSMSSISGIANGQRYDVRIRALHNDALTYSGWTAVPSCLKTLGAAGMVPWSNNEEQKLTDDVTIVQLYPNPLLQGSSAQLRSSQDIDAVQIFNAAGQLIAKTESLDQMRRVDLPSPDVAGLYWVVVRSGMETHRLAWLVQ